MTFGLHSQQCAAVGLATPNHRVRAAIHACLTPASDYASQQHDLHAAMSPDLRRLLLAFGQHIEHHHRLLVAWAAPRSLSQPVRLRLPPERTLQWCAELASCSLQCRGTPVSQSAGVSDRESCVRAVSTTKHTESRAHERIIVVAITIVVQRPRTASTH